jgi:hypothetical protein
LYLLDKACFLCLRVVGHRCLIQNILELSNLQRLSILDYYTKSNQKGVAHSLVSIVEDLGQLRYCGMVPSGLGRVLHLVAATNARQRTALDTYSTIKCPSSRLQVVPDSRRSQVSRPQGGVEYLLRVEHARPRMGLLHLTPLLKTLQHSHGHLTRSFGPTIPVARAGSVMFRARRSHLQT